MAIFVNHLGARHLAQGVGNGEHFGGREREEAGLGRAVRIAEREEGAGDAAREAEAVIEHDGHGGGPELGRLLDGKVQEEGVGLGSMEKLQAAASDVFGSVSQEVLHARIGQDDSVRPFCGDGKVCSPYTLWRCHELCPTGR